MMSQYAKYLLEREGLQTLETPKGFVTYLCPEEGMVYIQDIYVVPEHRRQRVATELADAVVELTKAHVLVGSIDTTANYAHESLLELLYYDMKLWKVEDNLIFFKKDLQRDKDVS